MKGFLCPLCNGEMIPERWQCEDGAWIFGWGCDCNEETREGVSELFIHSQAAQERAVEDICKELKEMPNKEDKCQQTMK